MTGLLGEPVLLILLAMPVVAFAFGHWVEHRSDD